MRIKKLIKILQKVEAEKGNIKVVGGSWCGTNGSHIRFKFDADKDLPATAYVTGDNKLSLSMKITSGSRTQVVKDIEDMVLKGYTFYPSQFRTPSQPLTKGVSSCEWHTPW
jgi:hypothetical protein|tara:strand:+ start:3108 stop:3440 length:333 start_codon:yes stop_codon:yes gene_type:complete